jgi:hypothetical protein
MFGGGGVLHWPSMTIWPGSQTMFPGSAFAAGAQSIPNAAPTANDDAILARSRCTVHPPFRTAELQATRRTRVLTEASVAKALPVHGVAGRRRARCHVESGQGDAFDDGAGTGTGRTVRCGDRATGPSDDPQPSSGPAALSFATAAHRLNVTISAIY